jgi:ABC-2 type transport system permease protein
MRDHGHPLVELTLARLREFVRDPGALFWTFGFPILLAIALGIAFRESPPPELAVAVDTALPEAEEIGAALEGDDRLVAKVLPGPEAEEAVRRGSVELLVHAGEGPGAIAYRFDPMRPDARTARLAVDDVLQRRSGRTDPVAVADEAVTEVGGRYIDFLIPGLIGLNLMGSAIWGIGFSVVDARKNRLLKRLAATPMSRAHFVLAYMLSRLVFLFAELAALVAFGWLVFGVAVRGSMLTLGLVALWGALAFTGIAMLIAARPQSTEAASGWANLVMLPMWLLSGAFFSYERFPQAMHPFIAALPLTAVNDALRAVMNEGAGLFDVGGELFVLAMWGVVCFQLALRLFRWQ